VCFVERSFDPAEPDSPSDRRFEFVIDGTIASPAAYGDRSKGQQR
jgi:hypothetical protein